MAKTCTLMQFKGSLKSFASLLRLQLGYNHYLLLTKFQNATLQHSNQDPKFIIWFAETLNEMYCFTVLKLVLPYNG